jgi:pyruvate formate lyase activating enzyme
MTTNACAPLAHRPAPAAYLAARAGTEGEVGHLHSFQTGSAVDGPGLRFVAWTTGCSMRCLYCHNPDTWRVKHGRRVTLDEMMAEIGKYERVLKMTGGGVTISGGEPLAQAPFVTRLLRACKVRGLHTVLDTNGALGDRIGDDALADVDLVLLDIKSFDATTHQKVTGTPVDPVLRFARRLSDLGKPAWIRFVLVPGLTDDPGNVEGLARFVSTLDNVERVEVLPFHQLGREKWRRLGLDYALADTEPPDDALLARVQGRLAAHGLPVR